MVGVVRMLRVNPADEAVGQARRIHTERRSHNSVRLFFVGYGRGWRTKLRICPEKPKNGAKKYPDLLSDSKNFFIFV